MGRKWIAVKYNGRNLYFGGNIYGSEDKGGNSTSIFRTPHSPFHPRVGVKRGGGVDRPPDARPRSTPPTRVYITHSIHLAASWVASWAPGPKERPSCRLGPFPAPPPQGRTYLQEAGSRAFCPPPDPPTTGGRGAQPDGRPHSTPPTTWVLTAWAARDASIVAASTGLARSCGTAHGGIPRQ